MFGKFFKKPKVETSNIDLNRLVRPQTKIDINLSSSLDEDEKDVRTSMILDHTAGRIVVAQTTPPISKSWLGKNIEASVVQRQVDGKSDFARWGWTSQILEVRSNYILNEAAKSDPMAVIFLSSPKASDVSKRNMRHVYRINIASQNNKIVFKAGPDLDPFTLLDFSPAGVRIFSSKIPEYFLEPEVKFEFEFIEDDKSSGLKVAGTGFITRTIELPEGKGHYWGFKFIDFTDPFASNNLHKMANNYMLEEQRQRHKNRERGLED